MFSFFKRRNKNKKPDYLEGDFFTLKDEGIIATWDKQTGQIIKKKEDAIRHGIYDEIQAYTFYNELDDIAKRRFYDKTIPYGSMQPLEASHKVDKVTDYGITLFFALIAGKSVANVSHMGAGDSTAATTNFMNILGNEKLRYAFSTNGYQNSVGTVLRFQMTFDILEATFTCNEIGLFNIGTANTGPMIARTLFSPGKVHTYGNDYLTASYLISGLSA